MPKPVSFDPFRPTFFSSDPINLPLERAKLIDKAIDVAASDTRFAEKLKESIRFILAATKSTVPTLASLNPATAVIGSPSFTLHVIGTGFDPGSIIYFAGLAEPTTFVSPTEVTTGINMDVWHGADVLPVQVQNPSGAITPIKNFTFTV